MKKLNVSEFLALAPDQQAGALCIFYPYIEGTDGPGHAHYVTVRLTPYPCETCDGEHAQTFYADGDPHHPAFCPACFKDQNETSEFYIGDDDELHDLYLTVEG
jgi:hypothetical protein